MMRILNVSELLEVSGGDYMNAELSYNSYVNPGAPDIPAISPTSPTGSDFTQTQLRPVSG